MTQNQTMINETGDPGFTRFAFDNPDNRQRQALQAMLFAQYSHLEAHLAEHPESAPAVTMATDSLSFLRIYVQRADTLHTVLKLDEWWTLYQGPSREFIDSLNARIEALNLLAELFAALTRLGLTVVHERPQA